MRLLRSFKTEHKRCWTNAGRSDLYSHSVRYNSLLSESESGLTMKTLRPYSIELNCSLFRLVFVNNVLIRVSEKAKAGFPENINMGKTKGI